MGDRCDFEFRMCRESSLLKKLYDGHVRSINKNFLEAVEEFENIAEVSDRSLTEYLQMLGGIREALTRHGEAAKGLYTSMLYVERWTRF